MRSTASLGGSVAAIHQASTESIPNCDASVKAMETWTRIEDVFPIEDGDIPLQHVSLPEGGFLYKSWIHNGIVTEIIVIKSCSKMSRCTWIYWVSNRMYIYSRYPKAWMEWWYIWPGKNEMPWLTPCTIWDLRIPQRTPEATTVPVASGARCLASVWEYIGINMYKQPEMSNHLEWIRWDFYVAGMVLWPYLIDRHKSTIGTSKCVMLKAARAHVVYQRLIECIYHIP